MIKEVEVSHLVTYLAKRNAKDNFFCTFTELRRIGNYIEKRDQTIRVELGERYCRAFRSRSVRHIVIRETMIEVDDVNTPIMQSLFRQYAPSSHVAALIEEAIKSK